MHEIKKRPLQVESLEHRRLLHSSSMPIEADIGDGEVRIQADAAGDTFGRARDIGALTSDRSFSDRVGGADKADVFKFRVDKSTEFTSTLSGLSADIDMYFFNSSGREVGRDAETGARTESLRLTLNRGEYYLLLIPRGSAESAYRLVIDVASSNQPANPQAPAPTPVTGGDAGNTFGRATDIGRLTGQVSRRESVGGADKADVIKFNVASRSTIVVKLHELSANADVFVFDISGDLIARDYQDGRTAETLSKQLSAGSYYVLVLPHGNVTATYTLSLANANGLSQVAPVPVSTPAPQPSNTLPVPLRNVSYFGGSNLWNVNSVNAPEAWKAGFRGQGVTIAVLDTGVDRNHADLSANIWKNTGERPGDGIDNDRNGYVDDVYGWNFARGNSNTLDRNGHGTHVAGIVGALRNGFGPTGIAYGAKIMPVSVMDSSGYGRTSRVAQGIRYAVDNGADIINLSFLGSYSSDIYSDLNYAYSKNVFVAIAAGNNGASTPSYPARHSTRLPNVVSVGAHDSGNVRSSISNRVGNSRAVQVDAPGQRIHSTLPGNRYGYYTGTSMATPHAAGIAALALSANPRLSAAQLRNYLVQGASRRISGSDSAGGINGARTVPLAHNGRGLAVVPQARLAETERSVFDRDQVADGNRPQTIAKPIQLELPPSNSESIFEADRNRALQPLAMHEADRVRGKLLASDVDAVFYAI